jgi:hypothetical protein
VATEAPPPDVIVFPFLVGCWRSGTTLLRSVFDSHPLVAVPDETNLLPPVLDRFAGGGFDLAAYVEVARSTPRWPTWGPDDALAAAIAADPPGTTADAVRLTFRAYAEQHGKPRYADKTPRHVMDIDRIAALLPEARFVHLVRDGRDVAMAIRDASFGPGSIDEAALHWRSRVLTGHRAGVVLGPARYMEVTYEALVDDPSATIGAVCTFIDLPFDEAMLDHTESARALISGTTDAGSHTSLAEPIRKGVRDWRRDMTPAEVARFDLLAGDALDELGYERGSRAPSVAARVDVVARRARLAALRTYRRARGLNSGSWW